MRDPRSVSARLRCLVRARALAREAERSLGRSELLALGALLFILSVTVAWWAVALWPVGAAAPAWLHTARAVCFGAHEDGLPNSGGWILLIGEPLGMVGALHLIWREPLWRGLRTIAASTGGRVVLGLLAAALMTGLASAGWRVSVASAPIPPEGDTPRAGEVIRALAGRAPPIELLDQHGQRLSLDRFRERPVLVTFAYGHCETVCPLLVKDALRAQRTLTPTPAVVVVTVDPWRDVPSRLPRIASSWGFGADAFLVSGEVPTVQRVLREWGAEGARDPRTGEVVHARLTYVVDGRGRLAFATSGRTEKLLEAVNRLR